MVHFSSTEAAESLSAFRSMGTIPVYGTLGLITLAGDVFLCVVNASRRVATVRPGEEVERILSVEFCR